MSTRATYHVFINTHEHFDLCFYKHHDGYPEGAADLFQKALDLPNAQANGNNFARRLINICGVEFTRAHKWHGDTDYQYDIDETKEGLFVTAYKRSFEEAGTWITFFDGMMHKFIETYKEASGK